MIEGIKNIGINLARTPGEVLAVDAFVRTRRTLQEHKNSLGKLTALRVVGTNIAMQLIFPAANRASLDYHHQSPLDQNYLKISDNAIGGGIAGFCVDLAGYIAIASLAVTNHMNIPEIIASTAGIHAIEHKVVDTVAGAINLAASGVDFLIDAKDRLKTPWE